MLRIAHFADVHLSQKASCGGKIVLDAQGRNIRFHDRIRCLEAVVSGAIERECDMALLAGDLFDGPKPSPADVVAAQTALRNLSDVMPTVLIHGNHDPALGDQPAAVEMLAGWSESMHVVTRPHVLTIAGLSIACLPFPNRAQLASREELAGLDPAAVNALISAKLRAIVRGLLARCSAGPKVLMAHLPIIGAALNESQQAGQEHISLTVEDLSGWDYVALGDLHLPQQVAPNAWYSGATDRTDFGMEHVEPGWNYVELDGGRLTVAHVPTPARRYATMTPGELAPSEPIDGTVYRVKGSVSQEEYDALQPALARWRTVPTFSEQLDVQRATRARSEAVTDQLSPEAALVEWAKAQGKEAELAELLEAHRELVVAAV